MLGSSGPLVLLSSVVPDSMPATCLHSSLHSHGVPTDLRLGFLGAKESPYCRGTRAGWVLTMPARNTYTRTLTQHMHAHSSPAQCSHLSPAETSARPDESKCVCLHTSLGDTEQEWLPEMDNQKADPAPVAEPMALVPQTPNLYPAT